MPMQPKPKADTSSPWEPSLRRGKGAVMGASRWSMGGRIAYKAQCRPATGISLPRVTAEDGRSEIEAVVALQERGEFLRRQGLAEIIALDGVAAVVAQELTLG